MNENIFALLVGQVAQGCWLGFAGALFLEFGEPQPLEKGMHYAQGEFGIQCECPWRLEKGELVLAGSDDEDGSIEKAIRLLNGSTFLSGHVSAFGDSTLTFTESIILRTFMCDSEEDGRLVLRGRDGNYLPVGSARIDSLSTLA